MNGYSLGVAGYLFQTLSYAIGALVLLVLLQSLSTGSASQVLVSPGSQFAVPALGFGSLAFVSVGWIAVGRRDRESLFKATGLVGLIGLGLVLGSLYLLFSFFAHPTLAPPTTRGVDPPAPSFLPSSEGEFLVLESVGGILILIYYIMEIVSLFAASRLFSIAYFRYAGIGRIVTIVAGISALVLILATVVPSLLVSSPAGDGQQQPPPPPSTAGLVANLVSALQVSLPMFFVPAVFSSLAAAIAFRKIHPGQHPTADAAA